MSGGSLPAGYVAIGDQVQCLTCNVLIRTDEIPKHASTHAQDPPTSSSPLSSFIVSSSDARPQPFVTSSLGSAVDPAGAAGFGGGITVGGTGKIGSGGQLQNRLSPLSATTGSATIPTHEMQQFRQEVFAAISNGPHDMARLREVLMYLKQRYPAGNVDDIRDTDGGTPLHRAVAVGNEDMCSLLLSVGSCPHNGRWSDGNTPMHEAAGSNRVEILGMLVKQSPQHCLDLNKRGISVIQVARERGAQQCEALLLEQISRLPSMMPMPKLAVGAGQQQLSGGLPTRMNSGGQMRGGGGFPMMAQTGPGYAGSGGQLGSPIQQQSGPFHQAMPPPRTAPNQPGFYGAPMPQNLQQVVQGGSPPTIPTTTSAMQRRTALERLPCEAVRLFTTSSLDAVQGRQTVERMLRESSQHFVASWRPAPTIVATSPAGGGPVRLVVVTLRITEVVSDRFIARNDAHKQLQAFLRGLDLVVEGSRDGYLAPPTQAAHFTDPHYVHGPITAGFSVQLPSLVWDRLVSYAHCDTYQKVLRNALIDSDYDTCRATQEGREAALNKAYVEAAKRLDRPDSYGYVAESAFESLKAQFPSLLTYASRGHATPAGGSYVDLFVYGSSAAELEQFYDKLTEVAWACDEGGMQLPRMKLLSGESFFHVPEKLERPIGDQPPKFNRLSSFVLPAAVRQKAAKLAEAAAEEREAAIVAAAASSSSGIHVDPAGNTDAQIGGMTGAPLSTANTNSSNLQFSMFSAVFAPSSSLAGGTIGYAPATEPAGNFSHDAFGKGGVFSGNRNLAFNDRANTAAEDAALEQTGLENLLKAVLSSD